MNERRAAGGRGGADTELKTRRRMARERRGAESSVATMETLNYKTIY